MADGDGVTTKTLWSVAGALFVVGASVAGSLWSSDQSHRLEDYHSGMPIYVEQRINTGNQRVLEELRLMRQDIQALREAMIANDLEIR